MRLELDIEARVSATFLIRAQMTLSSGVSLLVGPSGAGKTSFLRLLAGLTTPDRGNVSLDGVPWFSATHSLPPADRKVGLVMQSLALFPHLNVRDNVGFGLTTDAATKARVVDSWLERLRIGPLAARMPATLSGGEAQRVALARALAPQPRVLLLDEPFSALDDELRAALTVELEAVLAERETIVLVVTHTPADWHTVSSAYHAKNGAITA